MNKHLTAAEINIIQALSELDAAHKSLIAARDEAWVAGETGTNECLMLGQMTKVFHELNDLLERITPLDFSGLDQNAHQETYRPAEPMPEGLAEWVDAQMTATTTYKQCEQCGQNSLSHKYYADAEGRCTLCGGAIVERQRITHLHPPTHNEDGTLFYGNPGDRLEPWG